jgi:hypothetical protein
MRTTLFVCAWVASLAAGTQLLAQDCGIPCEPDCGVSEISIMFDGCKPTCNPSACKPSCNQSACRCTCNRRACRPATCTPVACGQSACAQPACGEVAGDEIAGGQAACDQAECTQTACTDAGCDQANCNQGGCNQDDCNPYTYYQLREDWRKTHGPILDTVRCLHNSCPKKHHHHNGNAAAQQRASRTPWHGNYYYPQWGAPVALVVPPTAEFQTNYSWGVPASRISPIDAQFSRGYPGTGSGVVGRTGFLPPPQQPSDTNQFGVYYVRGPW